MMPTPPRWSDGLSFQVTEIFSTSCFFSFQPPKDDGGMPLTFYTVERQDFSLKGTTLF